MSMQPKISVVIPAYNEEQYIKPCLESVFSQDFPQSQFEVIVVDNNCTDNTVKVASQFPIKIVAQSKQGVVHAKQKGCQSTTGDIIVVLDADNRPLHKNWLTNIYNTLTKSKQVAVTGPYRLPDNSPWWGKVYAQVLIYGNVLFLKYFRRLIHIWGGNIAFTKNAFTAIGGYRTEMGFSADEIFLRRDLQKIGSIELSLQLTVLTSTRRLKKGVFYFFIQFGIIEYLGNLMLAKLKKPNVFSPKPLREE